MEKYRDLKVGTENDEGRIYSFHNNNLLGKKKLNYGSIQVLKRFLYLCPH